MYKKIIIPVAAILFFGGFSVRAQDEMQTLSGNLNHSGGYGGLLFKSSTFKDKSIVMFGGRGMWVINRAFGIGFEGQGLVPIASYEGIDPLGSSDAFLTGGYGGLVLEPIIWSNKVVHITFPISTGGGWLGYIRDWEDMNYNYDESDVFDDDVFWYIEPGASIEVNVARFFRVGIGVTRRFTQDFELVETPSNEFDKFNFAAVLKFGHF